MCVCSVVSIAKPAKLEAYSVPFVPGSLRLAALASRHCPVFPLVYLDADLHNNAERRMRIP